MSRAVSSQQGGWELNSLPFGPPEGHTAWFRVTTHDKRPGEISLSGERLLGHRTEAVDRADDDRRALGEGLGELLRADPLLAGMKLRRTPRIGTSCPRGPEQIEVTPHSRTPPSASHP